MGSHSALYSRKQKSSMIRNRTEMPASASQDPEKKRERDRPREKSKELIMSAPGRLVCQIQGGKRGGNTDPHNPHQSRARIKVISKWASHPSRVLPNGGLNCTLISPRIGGPQKVRLGFEPLDASNMDGYGSCCLYRGGLRVSFCQWRRGTFCLVLFCLFAQLSRHEK